MRQLIDTKNFFRDTLYFVMLIAVATAIGFFFVYWADQTSIEEGICVDKRFTPSRTERFTRTVLVGKVMVSRPTTRQIPATWAIAVAGVAKDGKDRTEWWPVSEEQYTRINIGDTVLRVEGGAIEVVH